MLEGLSTSLADGSIAGPLLNAAGGGGDGNVNQGRNYAEILGAEIMRVGTWNGNTFTPKDLDDIVAAASEVGYDPPLKIGHDESIGARAWGWVRNIRVAGEKLVADLMDIPESLSAIIRERGYDQLSSEIYIDLDRDGRKFRRALKAVALLGAEIPAVAGLKPLRELFADADTAYWIYGGAGSKDFSSCSNIPPGYYKEKIIRKLHAIRGYPAEAICFTNQYDGGRTMLVTNPEDSKEVSPKIIDPQVAAMVDRLRDEAATMKAKAESQSVLLAEQAGLLMGLKERAQAQEAELKAQRQETAALQAKNREIALSAKMDKLKVPPVFKPFLEVYYRVGSDHQGVVKLAQDPANPEELSLEVVTDKLAELIMSKTSWMFGQLSVVESGDRYNDPGAEVDSRIGKLIQKDPGLDYSIALKQVLNADPALKSAYAGK